MATFTANKTKTLERYGATPGKLALAGCLFVVFLVMLIVQFNGGDAVSSAPKTPATASASTSSPQASADHSGTPRRRDRAEAERAGAAPAPATRWPLPPLSEIVAHDPFAQPLSFGQEREKVETVDAPPAPADDLAHEREGVQPAITAETDPSPPDMDPELRLLEQLQVSMIMSLGGVWVARIADEEIRVGDTIKGFRVSDINRDGVVVERTDVETGRSP